MPAKHEINLSVDAYDEFFGALQAKGIQVKSGESIVIDKDIRLKGPNYKQVEIRRDVLIEVCKVYKSPMEGDFETNDVLGFINFVDAVYKYILTGEQPPSPLTTPPFKQTKWK